MSDAKPTVAGAEPPESEARRADPSHGDRDGDLDLIRWSLALQVEERLSVLQDFVDTFWTPRHG